MFVLADLGSFVIKTQADFQVRTDVDGRAEPRDRIDTTDQQGALQRGGSITGWVPK